MGVSTDALLVYGYVWEDEHDLFGEPDDDDDENEERPEWDEVIARQRGIPNPWDAYPHEELGRLPYAEHRRRSDEWVAGHDVELEVWHAAKKAIEDEYDVEIARHGSDQWTVPIVKIASAGHRAHRGDAHMVDPTSLTVDPAWDGKLQQFITDLGIDTSEAKGPGWFLVSWWG